MLMADQWFITNHQKAYGADTCKVYEPIFQSYGYTTRDYVASVEYYIQEPDKFARILKNTSLELESEKKRIEQAVKVQDARKKKAKAIRVFRPKRLYFLTSLTSSTRVRQDSVNIYVDSLGGRWNFETDTQKVEYGKID